MTTSHVPRTAADNHGAWGAMAMVAALLLSVLLLVMTGLDRLSEATPMPMPMPEPPAAEAVQSGTEPAAVPAPAPAPQPGPIR